MKSWLSSSITTWPLVLILAKPTVKAIFVPRVELLMDGVKGPGIENLFWKVCSPGQVVIL